jgi:hypothetical protein
MLHDYAQEWDEFMKRARTSEQGVSEQKAWPQDCKEPIAMKIIFAFSLALALAVACWIGLFVCIAQVSYQTETLPVDPGDPPTGCYAYCDTRAATCATECAKRHDNMADCVTACMVGGSACRQACDDQAEFENRAKSHKRDI